LIIACLAIAVTGSVSAYAADWPGYGFDSAHSGANPAETAISPSNVAQLALAWSAPIGVDLRCTPVEANGVVYDTTSNGGGTLMTAYAYDLATGALRWKTDYPNPTTPSDPGVACIGGPSFGGGLLFVTDYYGYLGALNTSTGAVVWSTHLPIGIWGAPTYSNGVVYVADRSAEVTAFDASSGAIKWQTHFQVGNGNEVDSSPAVAGGLVVIGQTGGCFDGTCGGLWAFDQSNGNVRWHVGAGVLGHSSIRFESPSIAGGVVYVSIEDGGLDARDLATGQLLWTGTIANVTGAQNWSTPAVSDGRVFVAGNDGKLYAFAVGCGTGGASCSPIWTARLNGPSYTKAVFASPAVANGLVYIVGDDDFSVAHVNAFAVNCATGGGACSPLWSASLNYDTQTLGSDASSAIVANGTVLTNGHSVSGTGGSQPSLLAYRLPLDHVGLSPASSSITAGGSQTYTATGYDAANNSLGDMTSGTTFTISDGSCTGAICTATIAGTHIVTGTNSGKTGTATLTVNAAAATQLALSGLSSAAAGTAQTATVTLGDSYGNVATGYQGTVHFTSSDAQATLPADYTFVDAGTHTFPVTLKTAGSQSVTAANYTAGSLTGSQTVTITPAAASRLVLSGLVNAKSGTAQTAKVNLFDSFGNPATGYRGTVHVTSSDSQATLPADYTFIASDAGAHAFALTLKTPGSQSVTATDTSNTSITGSQTVTITPAVDLDLRLSVNPSTATTGTTVTASASLTNNSAVARSVTLSATFRYVSAYGTFTFSTSTVTVTLAAGQTLAQSFPFTVYQNTPRGNYTVTVTATDVSGTVSATASLVVV
jgi:outer membrane protein assembly factor BamB